MGTKTGTAERLNKKPSNSPEFMFSQAVDLAVRLRFLVLSKEKDLQSSNSSPGQIPVLNEVGSDGGYMFLYTERGCDYALPLVDRWAEWI